MNYEIQETDKNEIVQIEDLTGQQYELILANEKAGMLTQFEMAQKYPRNIKTAKSNMIVAVTMDKETAQACNYALPRGGKTIQGKSIHLARIVAQYWKHLRAEARIVGADATHVTSEAVCFDIENNIAIKVSVKRRITDKYGKRFNDDMITVTGNAANSIALRNAIFNVVPSAITDSVYKEAKNFITGDLSDETKLLQRRQKAVDHFKDDWKISEEQLLAIMGLRSVNQIKQDEIVTLIGLSNALKDGDTSVDELLEQVNTKVKDKETEKSLVPNKDFENEKPQDQGQKPEPTEDEKPKRGKTSNPEKTEDKPTESGGLFDKKE